MSTRRQCRLAHAAGGAKEKSGLVIRPSSFILGPWFFVHGHWTSVFGLWSLAFRRSQQLLLVRPMDKGERTNGKRQMTMDQGQMTFALFSRRILAIPVERRRKRGVVAIGDGRFFLLELRLGANVGPHRAIRLRMLIALRLMRWACRLGSWHFVERPLRSITSSFFKPWGGS